MQYPPFALAIEEPYVSIPIWPIQDEKETQVDKEKKEKERQAKLLQSQWGSNVSLDDEHMQSHTKNEQLEHVHLFDGKVLAMYLVSQLQFIDPLNRRDLTREEIINLDLYLRKHNLQQASVLEAFDSRIATLNRAGISGQSQNARATILQQEVRSLLNSFFQNNTQVSNNNNGDIQHDRNTRNTRTRRQSSGNERGNQFAQQYRRNTQSNNNISEETNNGQIYEGHSIEATGVYSGMGMLIIDDNANPGLRGVNNASYQFHDTSLSSSVPAQASSSPSISHSSRSHDFPALSNVRKMVEIANKNELKVNNNNPRKPKASKSLLKISNVIAKTNLKQQIKQKKAREEALRKMEVANLPFEEYIMQGEESNTDIVDRVVHQEDKTSMLDHSRGPTDKQIERNKILLMHLE